MPSAHFIIDGIVLGPGGRPYTRGAQVEAVCRPGLNAERVASDASGRFRLTVPSASHTALDLRIAAVAGKLRSLPWAIRVKAGVRHNSVLLRLRPASVVRIRAIGPDRKPVPFAELLVSSLPPKQARPYPPWEQGRSFTEDRIVRSGAQGVAQLAVREGPLRVQARRSGGVWGRALREKVQAGTDGPPFDVVVGGEPVAVRLRVVDQQGAPIEGAWVRLEDRAIRFGHALEGDETAHFLTRSEGEVSFRVDPSALPMSAAVGSPRHSIRSIIIDSTQVMATLPSRPTFRIRVRTPAGKPFALPVQWTVWPSEPAELADDPLARGLQVLLGEASFRAVGPGEYEAAVVPGRQRRLQGTFPGGGSLRRKISPGSLGRYPDLEFTVPRGRTITFQRLDPLPRFTRDAALGGMVRILSEPKDQGFAWTWNARKSASSNPLWIPSRITRVVLVGRTFPYFPWTEVRFALPQGDAVVDVGDRLLSGVEGAATVLLRLIGGGAPVATANLLLSCSGRPDSARQQDGGGIFFSWTDAKGECRLILPEGQFWFQISERFGQYASKHVHVRWRDRITVDLALW